LLGEQIIYFHEMAAVPVGQKRWWRRLLGGGRDESCVIFNGLVESLLRILLQFALFPCLEEKIVNKNLERIL
jgi:hypothetical protein